MQLPDGAAQPRRADNTLVKALARAPRWKRTLESGEYATIAELAEREGIAPSYMTRVLRLTLLAPDIVEAILDGKLGPEVTLARVMEPFPMEWEQQQRHFHWLPSTKILGRRSSRSAASLKWPFGQIAVGSWAAKVGGRPSLQSIMLGIFERDIRSRV